jgi:putative ABC transport system substrate-binding protein
MKKAVLLSIPILVVALLLAIPVIAQAQQPKKVPRIGYLAAASNSAFASRTEAFRQGLRELGYIEGKNILIEYRYADGKPDRVSALADELVRIKVDVMSQAVRQRPFPPKTQLARFPL